ncbi:MAG TPA: secretin N-terminal domain-containing protein [Pyrinomonadaceae bacterium]|nr:secretin N-terminal domain-containing protein [Pyrinomonadaceae bacterium]
MMKSFTRTRSCASLLIVICLLFAPVTVLAKKKGEKNFKRGLEHEAAQQWEKAAQEFALAVATLPSDPEYQLHYRRSVFNASQSFMQKGRALAEQGDYTGAYNAFRQAYGYDQVNELALSEMGRMLRLQREKEGVTDAPDPNSRGTDSGARVAPTSFQNGSSRDPRAATPDEALPARAEKLRVVNWNEKLEPLIRQLAEDLGLNVVFDRDFSQQAGNRQVNYKMRDVTTARALDYIFTSQGLFFQKLDRRTILVADQQKRPQYQQLVLRTFYVSNMTPEEARTLVQQALQGPGRPAPNIYVNKESNSITVRDAPETIRIIGELLQSVDKERAEVVIDVNIYEVSRTDLQRLGGQLGSGTTLGNLGGTSPLAFGLGGSSQVAQQALYGATPTALGAAIVLPSLVLSALQSNSNTKLVSSTQLHAFDREPSSTSVGRKVPIQTGVAPSYNYGAPIGGTPGGTGGTVANPGVFGSSGYPIIQYEQTGLDLKFTPTVYPNQDVQIKMEITTSDVEGTAGSSNLTPVLSNRKISGVARVQNNRTMMLASIAQDRQSTGRDGIPLLGLIPVIGRLFSTPRRDNAQSDIVITVTPRILRAPDVTPRDQELRPGGSLQAPATETLEAMVRDADRDDQLAAARQLPKRVSVQLPGAEVPAFVPAPKVLMGGAVTTADTAANAVTTTANGALPALYVATTDAPPPIIPAVSVSASAAELRLVPESQEMRVGEKRRLMLVLKTDAPLGLATATLRFDPRIVAVRSVSKGTMFGENTAAPSVTQSIDPQGVLIVSVAPAAGAPPLSGEGVVLMIEVEALTPGESAVIFDSDKVHLITADARTVKTQVVQSKVKVTQ